MTAANGNRKIERVGRLRWVPISLMRVSTLAQRVLNQARVDHLVATFDPEQIGNPTVSYRDGHYYIVEGQHRIRCMEAIGWGDQQVQCWVYDGLTEADEAEMFLKLNDTLAISAMDKFTKGVVAGRTVECDIDRIVRSRGLKVTKDKMDGAVGCVGTLKRIYEREGPAVLARSLRIVRDAYGTPGMEAAVLEGVALVCGRYNGTLDDEKAVRQLNSLSGGVKGLLQRAEDLRLRTGNPKAHCVAATIVDATNRGRGGIKMMSWWQSDAA